MAALPLAVIEAVIVPYRPVCSYGQEIVTGWGGGGGGGPCDRESGAFWGYSPTGPLPRQSAFGRVSLQDTYRDSNDPLKLRPRYFTPCPMEVASRKKSTSR